MSKAKFSDHSMYIVRMYLNKVENVIANTTAASKCIQKGSESVSIEIHIFRRQYVRAKLVLHICKSVCNIFLKVILGLKRGFLIDADSGL